jgi:hypothetical protein
MHEDWSLIHRELAGLRRAQAATVLHIEERRRG